MKRKTFFRISILISLGLVFPLIKIGTDFFDSDQNHDCPFVLSKFLSDQELNILGEEYLKLYPQENVLSTLELLIYPSNNLQRSNEEYRLDSLNKQIKQDFFINNIVKVKGWIISITEARLCAIMYLKK